MLLSEYVRFAEIDFDREELPEFIITIRKEYNDLLVKNNYVLEQVQYNEYAAKFARVCDWLAVQCARAKYLKESTESKLELILMREKNNAPIECKSDLARKKWVEQHSSDYQESFEFSAKAKGYYTLFEKESEVAKMNHYHCKGLSQSIDGDKGPGGFDG